MFGQFGAADGGLQRGDQAFQNQRGLAGTGNAGHDGQTPFGNAHFQRFDGVERGCRQPDRPQRKHLFARHRRAQPLFLRAGAKERPDQRTTVGRQRGYGALRQNAPAVRAGPGAHLHDPVGLRKHLCVVVDEQDGIAVRHKIVHDGGQPHDVGRVQADRRLVEHIQHAGRAVAHRPRQLHALALTGRERGGGAVQRKIAKPQIDQPPGCVGKRFADALRHRAHYIRQRGGHARHPGAELVQRHAAGFIQPDAAQFRRAGGL